MNTTVRTLLDAHEAQLAARLVTLHAEIVPLERELADVRRAKGALALVDHGPEQARMPFNAPLTQLALPHSIASGSAESKFAAPRSPYERLTIKGLILKALSEHFENGATANELLDFFEDAYGRSGISRTSLSPQLSRLKQDGKIRLSGKRWLVNSFIEKAATDQ